MAQHGKKTGRLEMLLPMHDKQQWRAAALSDDLTLSQWIRRACKAWLSEQRKREKQ